MLEQIQSECYLRNMKLTSADIRALIPSWLTEDKLFEFKETFNVHDKFQFTHDFDFIQHVMDSKNWKCMTLEESDNENFRVFNLRPLHLFGETFFVEVTTSVDDDAIISHLVGCE